VRRLPVVLGATALVLLSGGPAIAEEPFRIDEQVVDEAGVLGDEGEIEAALDELQAEDGTQLFVVFVDSFDGLTAGQWIQSTGELSGFGGNDALLAVAVEDDNYGFTVPSSSRSRSLRPTSSPARPWSPSSPRATGPLAWWPSPTSCAPGRLPIPAARRTPVAVAGRCSSPA